MKIFLRPADNNKIYYLAHYEKRLDIPNLERMKKRRQAPKTLMTPYIYCTVETDILNIYRYIPAKNHKNKQEIRFLICILTNFNFIKILDFSLICESH